ncbi:ribonuclease Z [Halobacteriovorax marinus]|uniref:Ribonuclease Z n=1 Tax=Halobacteriovorax marinus TaxID=97084 RepID=A0A1Y5F3E5_9BACT|nr:ribonuclease Z [Halobacteriovorax marinus]
MKLTFLGTSAGSPTRTRNVTGLALRRIQSSYWSLFDCGESTQHQIHYTSLTLYRLKRIFITHLHGDHIYGLAGIINSRNMEGSESPLAIYGPKGINEYVRTCLRISESHITFDINIHEIKEQGESFSFEEETVTAVPLSHNVTCFAYVIEEKQREGKLDIEKAKAFGIPVGPELSKLKRGESVTLENGRVIKACELIGPKRKGRKLIISGDNDQPELLLEHLIGCQLWVHEATYTEQVKNSIPVELKHSTAKSVASVARATHLKNLILTHFSVRFRDNDRDGTNSINAIYSEARDNFRENLFLAKDFDEFILDFDGTVSQLNIDEVSYMKIEEKEEYTTPKLSDYDLEQVKFALESGLGKLAKNMRILGFDVIYSNNPYDIEKIMKRAKKEERIILTRNRKLLKDLRENLVITLKDCPMNEQIKYLVNELGLSGKAIPLSRCIECNTILTKISKESIENQVPEKVYSLNDHFSTCLNCHKIYWRGSHYHRMHDFISKL